MNSTNLHINSKYYLYSHQLLWLSEVVVSP